MQMDQFDTELDDKTFNERVYSLVRDLNSFSFSEEDKSEFLDFKIDNKTVGLVHWETAGHLKEFSSVFLVDNEKIALSPIYDTFDKKTKIIEEILVELRNRQTFDDLNGWRNEHYYVRCKFSEAPLCSIERSAVGIFGLKSYGCHINGYVKKNGHYYMWIARRSKTKPTFPGMLDNFVGGGLTAGLTLDECARKELEEEAGVRRGEALKLKQVDCISYAHCIKGSKSVKIEGEFVFDIKLPLDFVPNNTDGEVERFYLMNLNQVKNAIISGDFKPNSAAVTLNFLMRKGLLTADKMERYYEIQENLHSAGL